MIFRICAFTTVGRMLIDEIESKIEHCVFDKKPGDMDFDIWLKESFLLKCPIIFVGAVGIAVRKIAPYINSKISDSPVIVIDEKGQFIIPILSGHVGGANEIALMLENMLGGQAVITTATDIQNVFAIDVFARKNGLGIVNKDGIKKVSSKLLEGGTVKIAIHPDIELKKKDMPKCIELVDYEDVMTGDGLDIMAENVVDVIIKITDADDNKLGDMEHDNNHGFLELIYKPYILGVGCKKNTEFEKIDNFIKDILKENKIDMSLVAGMASIDLKNKERGFLLFETKNRIPFYTFSAEELQEVSGEFSDSEFVKSVTGVSNVCERAAMKLAGDGAEIIVHKTVVDGMTLAVCRRKARIDKWEN